MHVLEWRINRKCVGAPIKFLLKKEHKQEFIKRFRAENQKDVEMGDEATG